MKLKTEEQEGKFCSGTDSMLLVPILIESHSYKFSEQPNYNLIKSFLKDLIDQDLNIEETDIKESEEFFSEEGYQNHLIRINKMMKNTY
jgi:hypothetical protein